MDSKYLYLALNILSILFPLIFSFNARANFSKKWKYVWPAIIITALPFILWDEWFTQIGIWGFNEKYLSGIYIFSLPLEEILFFICIPYACIFTYFALTNLISTDYFFKYRNTITALLIITLLTVGILNTAQLYTSITCISTAGFLTVQLFLTNTDYMGRFYFSFLFILIPFFLVNGILTGSFIPEEVVWYNNDHNLGIRLGTIPVEDVVYALLMLVMSVSIAELLEKRFRSNKV